MLAGANRKKHCAEHRVINGYRIIKHHRKTLVTVLVEIHTKSNAIICNGRRLATRSKGLLAFVCLLLWEKRARPEAAWVGMSELRQLLPATYGRQMLRFIDKLDGIDFPLEYESKTRGRYRLALPAEQVTVDVNEAMLERFLGIAAGAPLAPTGSLGLEESLNLLESFARMNQAQSQFYDGNMGKEADHAYHLFLCESETAPQEWRGLALLQLAKTCRCLNRYDEALAALRRLDALLRGGACSLTIKAALCKALVYIDQGRIALAVNLVKKLDMSDCTDASTQGEYYNFMGMLVYHEICQCRVEVAKISAPDGPNVYATPTAITPPTDPGVYTPLLELAAHYYRRSLALHAVVENYQAMQGICFNLGNLYLYAWAEGLGVQRDEQVLELGLKWVGQCEFICHKFGVGMDSVRSRIALLTAAMQSGLNMAQLNAHTANLFRHHATLEDLARATLAEAQAIGNRLEQAQLHAILMRLALQRDDYPEAAACRENVLEIYRELKRPDLARPFKVALPVEQGKFVPGE